MTEPIYKIGDVLSYSDTASTYLILAVKDVSLADTVYQYKCLKTRGCYCDEAQITWVSEFFFVKACNRVGHIDISWMTGRPDAKPTSGRYKWGEYESFKDWEEQEKKKWHVTDEDWPEIKKSLEDTGMIVDTTYGGRFNGKMLIKNLSDENEKLKNEIQAMKDELKEMKDKLDRKEHDIAIWKNGWYDCLKSLGYYLNS